MQKIMNTLNILNSLPHVLLSVLLLHLLYLRTWSVMQPFPFSTVQLACSLNPGRTCTDDTLAAADITQLLIFVLGCFCVCCMCFSLSRCICTNMITGAAVGCIDAIMFSCILITGSFEMNADEPESRKTLSLRSTSNSSVKGEKLPLESHRSVNEDIRVTSL